MTTPFNQLTPAEVERLAKLAEECGEVLQMVGKTLIHGWASFHPRDVHETSNKERLEEELGNLANIIDMMVTAGDVSEEGIADSFNAKAKTIKKYMHHQGE